jgi:membrane dipeptidase
MAQIGIQQTASSPRVQNLFAHSLVWDNHTCTATEPNKASSLQYLRRHKAAGVDLVTLNVAFDPAPKENAVRLLADFRYWIATHSDEFQLILRADDIDRARTQNKLGICFNIEGGCCLYDQLSMVSLYYDLGVRWMLFAYNHNNTLAGGCQDEDRGLTDFGRQVLTEMERVGMVVCASHIGERSALEILDTATRPVIFSHSNPKSVWNHARNISNAAIRACAAKGGVIGINGIGVFLGDNDIRTETLVRHIEYVVDLVGPDHVGIGLDYAFDQEEVQKFVAAHPESYPPDKYPNGLAMMAPEQLPDVAEALLQKGYSEGDIRKIMGENHLRIAREVWK